MTSRAVFWLVVATFGLNCVLFVVLASAIGDRFDRVEDWQDAPRRCELTAKDVAVCERVTTTTEGK